jgi:invasion protein IalB
MHKSRIFAIAIAAGAVSSTTASAQTVELAGTQGAWSLYADTATPKAVCFIAAQPQTVEPATAKRGPVYFYISAWPKEGVKTEPSIKVGYPIAADKEMTVTVGADTFKLFVKGERGFVAEAAEETKLLDALKTGTDAVVKATSARGTATSDTFALGGLGEALQKMADTCK